ncbi:MAG: MerR family DNA-binding transcriptional regulator [Actinomycetia bacterium]|nr:MerR family DNA-binding transcriptional regulator [Actinomycetes bacterium]
MPDFRIGRAADLLGVSPDTVRRLIDDGQLEARRSDGGHRVIEGTALAAYAVDRATTSDPGDRAELSARNRFAGIVTRVVTDKVAAQVEIQAGPHRIVSLLTREAVEDLGLEPGVLAVAAVKATSVMIERA